MLDFAVMFTAMLNQNNGPKTIAHLLGVNPEEFSVPKELVPEDVQSPDLPVLEQPEQQTLSEETSPSVQVQRDEVSVEELGSPISRFFSKDWVRYPLIFFVALGFFYVILNFRAVSAQLGAWIHNPVKQDVVSVEQISPLYKIWISKYVVHANDTQIFLGNSDPDQDGLTNSQEFSLGTNPMLFDTDRDGYSDGQEILNGYNPLYEGKLTALQAQIVNAGFDRNGVESRARLVSTQNRVAGAKYFPVDNFVLDPSKPGNVEIPKLGVNAAVIWSKLFEEMETDLKYGTAHHPGTPYPGQRGTASIHGHSSGYPWDGNYKNVFTKLNFLEPGDEVFITVFSTNNQSRRYRYVVKSKQVFAKDDQAQFADLGGFNLNLSTSWPVGSARERYVVITELTGI